MGTWPMIHQCHRHVRESDNATRDRPSHEIRYQAPAFGSHYDLRALALGPQKVDVANGANTDDAFEDIYSQNVLVRWTQHTTSE